MEVRQWNKKDEKAQNFTEFVAFWARFLAAIGADSSRKSQNCNLSGTISDPVLALSSCTNINLVEEATLEEEFVCTSKEDHVITVRLRTS